MWKFVFEMVDEIKSVISTYQRRLMEMPYVPKTSYGRASLGDDGEANKLFLTFLFSDTDLGIQFLKDVPICFAARCRVTLAVAIETGALNLNRRTVSDGDVEEELLSFALR